jgi:hypothetical protein
MDSISLVMVDEPGALISTADTIGKMRTNVA